MKLRWSIVLAMTLALFGTLAAECEAEQAEHRQDVDPDEVNVTDPASITVYRNADGHPNIGVVCVETDRGVVAFITTTNSANAYSGGTSGRSAESTDAGVSHVLCGEGQR